MKRCNWFEKFMRVSGGERTIQEWIKDGGKEVQVVEAIFECNNEEHWGLNHRVKVRIDPKTGLFKVVKNGTRKR